MKKKGFTLIESLIAVTIITIAVVGPLYSASRAIVAARIARDQLTASYLAQEGIEYVRAMRDDNYLNVYKTTDSVHAWDYFRIDIDQCMSTCTLGQANQSGILPINSGSPFRLMEGGALFTRTIQVINASTDGLTDVRIVSDVSWDFHGTRYHVTIYDHLTPWQ